MGEDPVPFDEALATRGARASWNGTGSGAVRRSAGWAAGTENAAALRVSLRRRLRADRARHGSRRADAGPMRRRRPR